MTTQNESPSQQSPPRPLARWWAAWIALYNAVFLGLLAMVSNAEPSFLGFLPTTVWIYAALLIVIAAGNWTFGWILMSRRR